MGVNSLPKTVTRQRRCCDLNPGPSSPESSTLTTRLPIHRAEDIGCSYLITMQMKTVVLTYFHVFAPLQSARPLAVWQ